SGSWRGSARPRCSSPPGPCSARAGARTRSSRSPAWPARRWRSSGSAAARWRSTPPAPPFPPGRSPLSSSSTRFSASSGSRSDHGQARRRGLRAGRYAPGPQAPGARPRGHGRDPVRPRARGSRQGGRRHRRPAAPHRGGRGRGRALQLRQPAVPPLAHRLAADGRLLPGRGRGQRRGAGDPRQPLPVRPGHRADDRGPAARLHQRQGAGPGPYVGGRAGRPQGRPEPGHRGARLRLLRPRRHRPVLPGYPVRPGAQGGQAHPVSVAARRPAQLDLPAGRGRGADRRGRRRTGRAEALARADRGADDLPRDEGADGPPDRQARAEVRPAPVAAGAGARPLLADARRAAAHPLPVRRPVHPRLLRLPADLRRHAHPPRRGAEGYARRVRIAMIGLGDIAEKAYLPVLAAHPGIDLHLCSRNAERLRRLGETHRIERRSATVEEVVKAGVDAAFVHAATPAHPEIVETLLSAGVHVYVDKPLADNLAGCERLAALAEAEGRSLMVGFNRRYAPGYAALTELPRHLVLMEKNRERQPDVPRRVVFDDFIHVVDTLRFLAPGEVTGTRFRTRVNGDGLLEHVVLELSGDGFTAIGVMNRASGAAEESCEVMGDGVKRRVVNLGDVIDYAGSETLRRRPDWVPVARQRGIEAI